MSLLRLKRKYMRDSREKKLSHFYALASAGQAILDVGVSSESKGENATRNYFLKHYRFDVSTYTGLGVQDLNGMESKFPGKRFVTYPGGKFPFPDKAFEWVFSNAVIEHVGNDDDQVFFINEMLRVSKNVFFTTPNKSFPVEAHTNIFFLHWNNCIFYKWCERVAPWCTKRTLNLLSEPRLRDIISRSKVVRFELTRNRVMLIPMTFTVVCSDSGSD